MRLIKRNISRKNKIRIAIALTVILALLAIVIYDCVTHGPMTALLSDQARLKRMVDSAGIFAPTVFILLQIFQTVVAPIPGNIIGILGGLLFGWWGVLWTTVGATLGYAVVFWLSRKFGRKLLEKIFKKKSLEKFDELIERGGSLAFFLFFLIPGLPDDILGYAAGLSDMTLRKLLIIAAIGRLPAVIASNMIGAGLGADDIVMVVIISVISVVAILLVAWKSEAILKWINSKGKIENSAE